MAVNDEGKLTLASTVDELEQLLNNRFSWSNKEDNIAGSVHRLDLGDAGTYKGRPLSFPEFDPLPGGGGGGTPAEPIKEIIGLDFIAGFAISPYWSFYSKHVDFLFEDSNSTPSGISYNPGGVAIKFPRPHNFNAEPVINFDKQQQFIGFSYVVANIRETFRGVTTSSRIYLDLTTSFSVTSGLPHLTTTYSKSFYFGSTGGPGTSVYRYIANIRNNNNLRGIPIRTNVLSLNLGVDGSAAGTFVRNILSQARRV